MINALNAANPAVRNIKHPEAKTKIAPDAHLREREDKRRHGNDRPKRFPVETD
jgi:hypothetical protein